MTSSDNFQCFSSQMVKKIAQMTAGCLSRTRMEIIADPLVSRSHAMQDKCKSNSLLNIFMATSMTRNVFILASDSSKIAFPDWRNTVEPWTDRKRIKMYGQPEYEMFLNDPDCSFGSNLDGNYKIDFKLDKCGTTVVQENGQLGIFLSLWSYLTPSRPFSSIQSSFEMVQISLSDILARFRDPIYCRDFGGPFRGPNFPDGHYHL